VSRRKPASVRIPLLSVFREAAKDKDARKQADERDAEGDRVISARRVVGRTGITEAQLRAHLSRDLAMLLNTVNLESVVDLGDFPSVRRSILNYGIPDIAHRSIDERGVEDIAGEIERALLHFEPRLAYGSIKVERDTSIEAHELRVSFTVRAEMISDPMNLPIEFMAEVQVDTGKILVGRV
jgi:type VI secretion system protein ImpF